MDMKEDSHISILLGRPFLATSGAIINVKRRELTFEVGDEKIEFIMSQFMNNPSINDLCGFVDIIEECIMEFSKEIKDDEVEIHQDILDESPIDQNECFVLIPNPTQETIS